MSALTKRQHEVLRLAANGLSTTKTAERLWLTPATVKFHRHRVLLRLDARNMAEAVAIAYRAGLLTREELKNAA